MGDNPTQDEIIQQVSKATERFEEKLDCELEATGHEMSGLALEQQTEADHDITAPLVVCKTSGTNLKGNPMFGVEIRRKTADGFEAVDNALNRPFHDEEEADRYLFRLERMAADYARLADWVTD